MPRGPPCKTETKYYTEYGGEWCWLLDGARGGKADGKQNRNLSEKAGRGLRSSVLTNSRMLQKGWGH